VTFLTNTGDSGQISVAMTIVPAGRESGDAGLHHIQLLDGMTGLVIAATTASLTVGS
jgi:hypothetical protein